MPGKRTNTRSSFLGALAGALLFAGVACAPLSDALTGGPSGAPSAAAPTEPSPEGTTYGVAGEVTTCSELAAVDRKFADAAPLFAACIARTPVGGILDIPAGRYLVNSPIVFDHAMNVRTAGIAYDAATCDVGEGHGCAEIAPYGPAFRPERFLKADKSYDRLGGIVKVVASGVGIDHLVINGNRAGLLAEQNADGSRAWTQELCLAVNVRAMAISASSVSLTHSVVKNALCNAGIHVIGPNAEKKDTPTGPDRAPVLRPAETGDIHIVSNTIAFNGDGRFGIPFMFSDGLVIFDGDARTEIAFNRIYDNTDVHLIFGGCPGCNVHDNFLGHTAESASQSHGALMIHAWPQLHESFVSYVPTTGNYTGARIWHNYVDCLGRCGVGALFGANPWYLPYRIDDPALQSLAGCADPNLVSPPDCTTVKLVTTGGEFYDNTILNASLPLAIDDARGLYLHDNAIGLPNGNMNTTRSPFWPAGSVDCSAWKPPYPRAVLSPNTVANTGHNVILLGFGFQTASMAGCIQNYVP